MQKRLVCSICLLAILFASCARNTATTDQPSTDSTAGAYESFSPNDDGTAPATEDVMPTQSEPPISRKTIYVISWSAGSGITYRAISISAINNASEDLDCDITITGISLDSEMILTERLLLKAIDENIDALIFTPVDFAAHAKAVSDVYQAGVPVVLVGDLVDTEDYSAFIRTDEVNAGRIAAMELMVKLKSTGLDENEYSEIAIQINMEGSAINTSRLQGFREYWEGNAPEAWVILWNDIRVNDSNYEKAIEIAYEFINEYQNLKGMFTTSIFTTACLAAALMERERNDITLLGFGWPVEMENMIREGYSASTIHSNQYFMSYESVRIALELANGGEIDEKVIDAGVIVINAENIDSEEVQAIAYW